MPLKRNRSESQNQTVQSIESIKLEALDAAKAMSNNIGNMQNRLSELNNELNSLNNGRENYHYKTILTKNINILKQEIEKIENGDYIKKVDTVANSYQLMQTKLDHAVGITNKKQNTIKKDAQNTEEYHEKSKQILSEFNHKLNGTTPLVRLNNDDSTCIKCGGAALIQHSKSALNCQICGYSALILDATAAAVSFGEEVAFNSSFSYKRSNHFADWLARTQAKETYVVSDDVVKQVMAEMAAQKIHPSEVNQRTVLKIMKEKKMKSKAYNYATQVTMRCTGVPPPRLTSEMDQLANLIFIAIQEPFEKHAPTNRKNFLSYAYCVYRIYELLGADDLLENLPLLTGKGKIAAQDDIMEKIFAEMEWEWPGRIPESGHGNVQDDLEELTQL